jgi:hypothetical protein
MSKVYASSIIIQCWKAHTCVSCGGIYSYNFVRRVTGEANNRDRATANAQITAEKVLAREVNVHPCPSCGLIQPEMIRQQRTPIHYWTFWIALVLLSSLVIARIYDVLRTNIATWIITFFCAAVALAVILNEIRNPNKNLSSNVQLANSRVAIGQVRMDRPGRSGSPVDEFVRPRRSIGLKILFLLLIATIPLAASPELFRLSYSWPLNEECYPPVVGPGDETRIYMNQTISSINGYWRGKPKVTIHIDGDLNTIHALAYSSTNYWGSSISAKSSDIKDIANPDVLITVPNEASLAGKTARVDINLDVEHPITVASLTFETQTTQMYRTVPLRVASISNAGKSYDMWWWAGTLLAITLTLLGPLWLYTENRAD